MGTRHIVAAGHYLAAQAGLQILEAGGNAIDAGVAAGLALGVVESELVSVAGVAPIMLYLAESNEVLTISGLGGWPRNASTEFFQRRYGGAIPKGIHRTVVPAAPDAWITALERYGTMSFSDVAVHAIRFARDGFPMYPLMAKLIAEAADSYRTWPANAAIYLPNDRPPEPGDLFVQRDLGRTLQFLCDEETAHSKKGRVAGLQAVRDAFYRGDIAAAIVRFHEENDGLLTARDLAEFSVEIERPVRTRFGSVDIYSCGAWSQGPMLLQILGMLNGTNVTDLGHNSAAYVHLLTETIKLAAADREAYFGDPRFVHVPLEILLSEDYARGRRQQVDMNRAWPEMPPPGAAGAASSIGPTPAHASASPLGAGRDEGAFDTSYVCVVDRHGNVFSATPSDGSRKAPVVPGTGFVPSARGQQSWCDPDHPSSIAPGKRPRLTPNPALAVIGGRTFLPFGSPGGDVQTQAMLQVFLNIFAFGMDPQSAVEAPRFASYSFPSSFEPHEYQPGLLRVEAPLLPGCRDALTRLGHKVVEWPERTWLAGAVCAILTDRDSGILSGCADPRRPTYAVGW